MLPQLPVSYFIITYNTASHSGVVQLLSCVQLFATPWNAAHQDSLSFTISQSLLKFVSIESAMPSNHLILCLPVLLLPSASPSMRVFSVSQLFTSGGQSMGPSALASVLAVNIQGLISFRIDWFDHIADSFSKLVKKEQSVIFIVNGCLGKIRNENMPIDLTRSISDEKL